MRQKRDDAFNSLPYVPTKRLENNSRLVTAEKKKHQRRGGVLDYVTGDREREEPEKAHALREIRRDRDGCV